MNSGSSDRSSPAITSIETTIGELVEIIMGIALESCYSEQEASALTSVIINDLLLNHQAEA